MSAACRAFRVDRTVLALLAIAAAALLARLVWLGARVAHWDEGRVGYEILRFMATGGWEYRPIVHGPFLPHVNRVVFSVLGANDFSMRLVVAIVGGLLPLAAWLYRDYLRDREVIVLALFLAADPILLYYSRFMRNDVLVAGFAFAALGFLIRARDSGRSRYLYAGVGLIALAFTVKENALLYPLTIIGGLVLLFDHRLFLARREPGPDWTDVLRRRVDRTARGLWGWRLPIVIGAIEFLAIIVFFYAPRAATPGEVGLFRAFAEPSILPAAIEAGSIGAADKLVSSWITGTHQDHAYLPFLGHYLEVLGTASGALALLAVLGFVTDRYAGDRPRDIVALGFYWGVASVVGYPIAIDIKSAWAVIHAVVPLAIPATVGVTMLYDWGEEAVRDDDRIGVGLAAVVLLLVAGQVAATGVSTSYLHPQSESNVLIQYAQPEGEMRPALEAVHQAARGNDGLDVLWYGDHFYVENESDTNQLPVSGGEWYNRLPMPWYLERFGAETNSTNDSMDAADTVATAGPPVVLTRDEEADEINLEDDGYRDYCYEYRQFDEMIVFYFDESYAPDDPAAEARCDNA